MLEPVALAAESRVNRGPDDRQIGQGDAEQHPAHDLCEPGPLLDEPSEGVRCRGHRDDGQELVEGFLINAGRR